MPEPKFRISPFSTVLVMLVLMTIGAGIIPLLSLQFTPGERTQYITVSYNWANASAKVIEQEVTSKIEGVLAGIRGGQKIRSHSYKGQGRVELTLKKGVDIGAVRFEISSLIRQIYPKLPEGVSYPYLSLTAAGYRPEPMLRYTFNADMTPLQIQSYVERHIITQLSRIHGVNSADLSGANPFYYEVAYDSDKMRVYGVTAYDLQLALQQRYGANRVVGSVTVEEGFETQIPKLKTQMTVRLENGGQTTHFEQIYVKTVSGRDIYLGDIAQVTYREQQPLTYSRLNGLNTVDMVVYPERGVNVLSLAKKVKSVMRELEAGYPPNFSSLLRYDVSKDIVVELNKIFYRTALSMFILLIFVFVVSRSWRYLGIIVLTLSANILVSFIFFYLFDVDIHIYSMAGITVSLGMVIDSSIIMIDHYGYYRNKRAFLSILAALLTTVGALIVVFFLPDATKVMLVDFSKVIIICLCVSLVIAWFFVPVLVDRFPIRTSSSHLSHKSLHRFFRRKRRLASLSRLHGRLIFFFRRFRWALLIMGILGFGLPIQLLPTVLKDDKGVQETKGWRGFYNRTVGGNWYQSKGKPVIEPALGGTLRLFTKNSARFGFRDPSRLQININAYMPEGSTIEQMNEAMKSMENYLSQYEQIDMYHTTVRARAANMSVTFKKEYEHSAFPSQLKQEIIYKCISSGAANWAVSGIDDQNFSNVIYSGEYYAYSIVFSGYNYDRLYELASDTKARLDENRRISKSLIYSQADNYSRGETNTEFYIDYNQEQIAYNRWSLNSYYAFLRQQLLNVRAATLYEEGVGIEVRLASAQKDDFDVWHIENDLLDISGRQMKLSELGSIEKRRTGNNIYKEDQQYMLRLGFDFVGTSTLANRVLDDELMRLKTILPVGYKAEKPTYGGWWDPSNTKQYRLLFLIIAVVYFMCAILFESLKQPFIIIMLIPLSFIGVFLTFHIFGFYFDQGGFASMILLCGIVVNSGIYFVNEYNLITRGSADTSGSLLNAVRLNYRKKIRLYVKAFNHKITPISLTILSTILGLIPFLLAGSKEVFWFSFAVGAMGGMLFSFVALFLYLPAFLPMK